jgi:hypothetical protein
MTNSHEMKLKVLSHFLKALQASKTGATRFELSENDETVIIHFASLSGGYSIKVNVDCDSPAAMMFDILKKVIE